MTVEKVGQVIEKAVFKAPKFTPEEIQIARQQAKIRNEMAKVKQTSNGYVELVKDITITPIVNAAKHIKDGVVEYFENIKFNFDLVKENKAIKKGKVADLQNKSSKLTEDFNARRAFTTEDNLRIEKENAVHGVEQAPELKAIHDKTQGYYNLVGNLDTMTAREQQLKRELEQLNIEKSKINEFMDQNFPESIEKS